MKYSYFSLFRKIFRSLLLCNLLVLLSCSGGETGTGVTDPDVSVGTITGFGSVFVNGIEFDTTATQITIDGAKGVENELKIGMVVTINGTINVDGINGVATLLSAEEVIKGPVQSNDNATSIVVLGQMIEINSSTLFENNIQPNNINGLNISDVVEVSGYVIGNGVIAATRIEKLDPAFNEYEIEGFIGNLNDINKSFSIGSLTVNFIGAEFADLPNNQLSNSLKIKVKGSYDINANQLVASEIKNIKLNVTDADSLELEGFVTSFTSVTRFSVNAIAVQTNDSTVYRNGIAEDITLGIKIEVEGALVNGVLIAEEIEFEEALLLEADIASVDVNSGIITLTEWSTINIMTNSLTEVDGINAQSSSMDVSLLNVGDHVRIRGMQGDAGITATRVDVKSSSDAVLLQGPVDIIDIPSIKVLGIVINTDAIPGDGFVVENAMSTQTLFFEKVELEKIVKVEGVTVVQNGITWTKIELYD